MTGENQLDIKEITARYEKRIYDLQQFLQVAKSLCSTLKFTNVIQSILFTAMSQVHVTSAGVFIIDALDSDVYRFYANDGFKKIDVTIKENHPFIDFVKKAQGVIRDEDIPQKFKDEFSGVGAMQPSLFVPLKKGKALIGILVLGERIDLGQGTQYNEYEKWQMQTMASLSAVAISNATLMERSSTDMMTKLKLKYYFLNSLTEKLEQAGSLKQPLSVIMTDIDFFKKVNDTYGHLCGDYVLKSVAKVLMDCVRSNDMPCRYGGEEFVVMLSNTTSSEAVAIADRIRSSIEKSVLNYEGQEIRLTISCGVATFDAKTNPVSTPKGLVEQSDKALYFSKRNGRNRVTFADSDIIKTSL